MSLRIASLVPSVTELLVALGLAPHLVARTGFCIHPREVLRAVPKVGGTKDVNLPRLRALAPTHVIVNVDENELPTVQALRDFVPHVIVTHPCAPEDNFELYRQMAEAFGGVPGVRERADELRTGLAAQLSLAAGHPWPERKVLYCIWREPWMTVARDTYISHMLALVNWRTLPDGVGGPVGAARYPVFDGTEDWIEQVDEVLLSSEPYRFGATHADEVRAWLGRRGWHGRVRLVDGEMLSWYGARAVQGVAYLCELARA